MDRATQFAAEFRALRTLCDEAIARNLRQNLIQSLGLRAIIDPEHRIVFESIRALFQRGPVSLAPLRVHLTNRGFPDTDVEKYFQSEAAGDLGRDTADKATP